MNTNVDKMRYYLTKSAPDLFLAGGVLAIIGGGALAIKQTPKAMKILEKKEKVKTTEKIKAVAPLYIPSILLTGIGVTSVICSRNITNRKIAAMTTAYTMSEKAFKTYKSKVKEMVDEKKYEDIDQEVAKEKMREDPIGNKEVIITAMGNVLIYDSMSGRYFRSSINEIERSANLINKKMRSEMTVQLNEFYSEIGLTPIKIGCDMGWSIDESELEPRFTSSIAENGDPCLVLDYEVVPIN